MARTPDADVLVDDRLVADLVGEQFPEFADRPLRLQAAGWDNTLYRLGDDLVVRLPRREASAVLIDHEARWLPELAPLLPTAAPVPLRTGRPTWRYPWSWTIAPWIDGRPAIGLSAAERAPIARSLAEALCALHVPAPAEAPHNPVRGVDLRLRDVAVRGRLTSSPSPAAPALEVLWSELVDTVPWRREPVWIHGDAHPGNVLVDDAGVTRPDGVGVSVGVGVGVGAALVALIDFGDVCAGDPATDLAAGWLFFDADARAEFRATADAIGGYESADWQRARAWALVLATAFDAHSDDDRDMAALAAHTLTQVLVTDQ